MEIFFEKKIVGKLPIKPLADSSPEYDRPAKKPAKKEKFKSVTCNLSIQEALIKIISSPNHSSKKWIFNQYDKLVMCDTLFFPNKQMLPSLEFTILIKQ